jgi:hypothetical protein
MTNNEFAAHVTKAFAYLDTDYAATRTAPGEWCVQYTMGDIELVISYDPPKNDYALTYRFDPKSRHTHELSTICKAMEFDHAGRLPEVVEAENLAPFIPSSAEVLREVTGGILRGDKEAIAHVAERLSAYGNDIWKRIQERRTPNK